ncbi:MAG: BON domain-containing protein [Bdellovibrionaceae bacterium]|nr:BON domain-containing protein [Pseudobdellovibrionaceae bacterium]
MKTKLTTLLVLMMSLGSLAATQPDNTELNKRDQRGRELTADKHGTSEKDIKISAELRQAVVNDKSLSTYAQNIKIITVNGEVTLKGPVKSVQEQRALLSKAKAVGGVAKVHNNTQIVTE